MKRIIPSITLLVILLITVSWTPPDYSYKIGLLKYNGGGDWYANLETSLRNLVNFCNQNIGTNINPEQGIVATMVPLPDYICKPNKRLC